MNDRMNTWTRCSLPCFSERCPNPAGETPLCQSFVPFTSQALHPSQEPKAFIVQDHVCKIAQEGWTWTVKSGIPLIFVLLGEVECACLLCEQHYIT